MIDEAIRRHIQTTLANVAAEHGVRILYASESGSRAWGFGSPDSDYDVRFIYAHERDWYVSLDEPRDVIERPLDERLVDLAGWDVRKALRLMLRSNPAFYEWLVSPIVYADDASFRPEAARLFVEHASPKALAFHYWSIARGQWHREIGADAQVRLKKYFYVVRPLLSLGWVVAHGTPPPMMITALLQSVPVPGETRAAIDRLLEQKRSTPEIGRGERVAAIDSWALDRLSEWNPSALDIPDSPRKDARRAADELYRRIIGVT